MRQRTKEMHEQHSYRILNNDSVQNATWILTNKESGEIIKCNYDKIRNMVREGYIRHNKKEQLKSEDIRIRFLYKSDHEVYDIKSQTTQKIGYDRTLPEYTIECHGYTYQCNKCNHLLSQTHEKDKRPKNELCTNCLHFVTFD